MKKWVRVLALSLVLAMVLGVSAAYADAYTVPKTLKDVTGLPENPEVPTMKTKNDGKTETVTVDGQLASLAANWGDGVIPLTLENGTATFDITGHNTQQGMEGKFGWAHFETLLSIRGKWIDYEYPQYFYYVNQETLEVTETVETGFYEYKYFYDTPYTASLEIPTDSVTEKVTYTDGGYHAYKTPYVGVGYPEYTYYYPTSGLKHHVRYYVDPDTKDPLTGKVTTFDGNGNYILLKEEWDSPDTETDSIISMTEDADLEAKLEKFVDDQRKAYGLEEYYKNYWDGVDYDPEGFVQGMYHVDRVAFWAEDINGYGKAFEGKTTSGVTVGYNRKGEACEKIIEMPAGTDFFASETAPSKVTVTWLSGKSNENKTVWYVSSIAQEYANETVTARFAQGGKNIGIKKVAK